MTPQVFERMYRQMEAAFHAHGYKFFLCFGMLLHLIRDGSTEDDDVDFGVYYEQFDYVLFVKIMERSGFKLKNKILHDVDKKALYLSFSNPLFPPVDVFAWYLHDGIRYHTYDVHFEKRDIPSEYVFKGVEDKYLPDPTKSNHRDPNMVLANFGPRKMPIFRQDIFIPYRYGTLLDRWYPNWLVKRSGESRSIFTVRMKSCKQWKDSAHVKAELEKSRVAWENGLKAQ